MSVRFPAAALLAASLLAVAVAPAPAQSPASVAAAPSAAKRVLSAYQVTELVVPVRGTADSDKGKTREDGLIRLIQNSIAPKSWSSMGGEGTIDYFPMTMTLVINQTPDVQERIADLLERLRREQDTQIALEVRLVTVAEGFFERIGVDFNVNVDGQPGQVISVPSSDKALKDFTALGFLNDKQVAQLFEAIQVDQRTNVLQAPKLTLLSGQTGVVDATDKQTFVTGVEVSRRENQMIVTPKTEEVVSGFRMSACPKVSADRRFVRLDLEVSQTDLASTVVPLFPVTVQAADGKGKPTQFNQLLQQPKVNTMCIEKTLSIPDGGTAVFGGVRHVTEARNDYGPPVLSKVPYVNRLFRNVGTSTESQLVYVLVTPRVIVAEEEEARLVECGHCKDAATCVKAPVLPRNLSDTEECEPHAPAKAAPVCRQTKVLAELLKAYDEACAEGHTHEAAKLAQAALTLDPTCFAKGHGR